MTVITGYAGTDKTTLVEPVTCQPHDRSRVIIDTLPVGRYLVAQNKVVTSTSTKTVVNAITHGAKRGDYIIFESLASIAAQTAFVLSATTNSFVVAQPFLTAPIVGDTFSIYRPTFILTDGTGVIQFPTSINATITSPVSGVSPSNSATGVVTRPVGSLDGTYGDFSTPYTWLTTGGYDATAQAFYPLPLQNSGGKLPIALYDANGNIIVTATTTPGGADRGIVVRNIPSGTQAISAASLPLPSGASTAANQTTVIGNDPVTSLDYLRVGGYDVEASGWYPIPTSGFGTYVPVGISTGIYGAGIANSGNLTAAAQSVILNTLQGYNEGVIQLTGVYSATFAFEALVGSTWTALPVWRADGGAASETSSGALVSIVRSWRFNVAGFDTIRVRCSAYTSGTANVAIQMVSFGAHTGQTLLPTGQTTMAGSTCVSLASDQTTIPTTPAGNVAHDAADSSNPVKVGARARTTNITAVSSDDRVDAISDRIGRSLTLPYSLDENIFTAVSAADITNTSSTAVKAATASTRYWISAITVSNMHATVSTRVDILDGSTVIWSGPAAALGGGYSITFPTPKPLTTNTAINARCGTTGAAVRVAICGYTGT